jgi:ankyrin repeat protein
MENLLKAGPELSPSDFLGNTPLHLALTHANPVDWVQLCLVEKLLDHGADVNLRNAVGMTPFQIALEHLGSPIPFALIAMFLQHEADVGLKDRKGIPPFQMYLERCRSFRYGHPSLKEEINSVVKAFLAHGASPNATSQTGDSLLCWLLRCGDCLRCNPELVLLICEKANVNFRGPGGNYPLHEVTTCSIKHGPNCVNVLQYLLDRGADPNAVNDAGVSPLLALMSGKGKRSETLRMTKALLENGADPMLRDSSGRLAVYEAAKFYEGEVQRDIVRELLSASSNLEELFNGRDTTPIGHEELWWQLFDVALQSSRVGYPGIGLRILRDKGRLLPATAEQAAIHAAALTVVAEIGLHGFAFEEGDHSCGAPSASHASITHADDLVCGFSSLFRYCEQLGIEVDKWFHYQLDYFE